MDYKVLETGEDVFGNLIQLMKDKSGYYVFHYKEVLNVEYGSKYEAAKRHFDLEVYTTNN